MITYEVLKMIHQTENTEIYMVRSNENNNVYALKKFLRNSN